MLVSVSHSVVFDSASPWTVARQAPLSMGFSTQEHWTGQPFPSGDLPDPVIKPESPALQADSTPSEPQGSTKQVYINVYILGGKGKLARSIH